MGGAGANSPCGERLRQLRDVGRSRLAVRGPARPVLSGPCSQFRRVAAWNPNFAANAAWLNPRRFRTERTSIVGTSTVVTRTGTSFPSTQSIASFRLAIIRLPALCLCRLVVRVFFISRSSSGTPRNESPIPLYAISGTGLMPR
jgi:hypothetical protein